MNSSTIQHLNPPPPRHTAGRILIAEDSPVLLAIMVNTLQSEGYDYEVDTAENGQQAIEAFLAQAPDLILMDADMPVLDGISACEQIKRTPEGRSVPVVMVTGYGDRDWVDRAYQSGATDYVMKPINWDVLRNRIDYMLKAKKAEEALFDEKEKAQVTLESIGDGVITTDALQRVEYLNPVASLLTGWKNREAIGQSLSSVFNIVDECSLQTEHIPLPSELELPHNTSEITPQMLLLHKDGQQQFAIEDSAAPIRDRDNHIIGMVLVFHDVTLSRQMARDIEYQAHHDSLTGLINRREFEKRLQILTEDARLNNAEHALLYMDLDRFKIVNDTCTHAAGDELLRQVSKVVRLQIRQHDTAARLGGDEFGFLLEHCPLDGALVIAEKICQAIQAIRFSWDTHVFSIGASIGVVSINQLHGNMSKLLSMADAACSMAKDSGRNQVQVYHEEKHQRIDSGQWLARLHESLERDQFLLFQQAIVPLNPALQSGEHYEILVRMQDPAHPKRLILPGAFFSAADRYNLLPTLDRWVVKHFCQWLHKHPEHLDQLYLASINLADSSLGDKNFPTFVQEQFQHYQIPGEKICFEFTELGATTNISGTQYLLGQLKLSGCRFALDNFGTGSASFSVLRDLKVDFLKIQGSLINNVLQNDLDKAIVHSINDISHVLQIRTIAEFIETQEPILTTLRALNIDYAQGYGLAKPKILKDF